MGIVPTVYCAPNHLYNQDTLIATRENGFKLFLTRNGFDYFLPNMIELPVYEDNGLLVFSETKKGKSPVRMSYYDNPSECLDLIASSSPLTPAKEVSLFKIRMNEGLIRGYKKIRDLVR